MLDIDPDDLNVPYREIAEEENQVGPSSKYELFMAKAILWVISRMIAIAITTGLVAGLLPPLGVTIYFFQVGDVYPCKLAASVIVGVLVGMISGVVAEQFLLSLERRFNARL